MKRCDFLSQWCLMKIRQSLMMSHLKPAAIAPFFLTICQEFLTKSLCTWYLSCLENDSGVLWRLGVLLIFPLILLPEKYSLSTSLYSKLSLFMSSFSKQNWPCNLFYFKIFVVLSIYLCFYQLVLLHFQQWNQKIFAVFDVFLFIFKFCSSSEVFCEMGFLKDLISRENNHNWVIISTKLHVLFF